ncbi:proteasome subunit alpha [Propionibacterium sp.]|uniref:proteasome subunit alpha n=1 Tax=Propionibacterium sp. TaxID=1977903 RepID=UPI0039EBB598
MSMPFYVSPDQLMKDRAEFARKGIARGRSVVTARYRDGIVFVAANASRSLHKISEIYDQIGFGAVGRYHEFESLRVTGVRYADLRGYAYDRSDVAARGLVNSYAQLLGAAFSSGGDKPLEVELVVAEVGLEAADDTIFRISFDGTVAESEDLLVIGGSAETLEHALSAHHDPEASLGTVLREAVTGLLGETPDPGDIEAAVLDRTRVQPRKFARLSTDAVAQLMGGQD